MVRSELVETIAQKQRNLTIKDIEYSVGHILDRMSLAMSRNERIEIRGFGSFTLHYHGPRNAHNPKTGEKVVTLGKHTPYFKPGKELRERVNTAYLESLD